jgi:hypothetical protein
MSRRDPGHPEPTRRALRAEVRFGCPVRDCGSPYLTYHHFDPPYRTGKSHDPNGMIAMCLHHHRVADVGTWTDDQLRGMKAYPFLSGGSVGGRLEWLSRDVLVQGGGNCFLNPGILLEVGGRRVIWAQRDSNGLLQLSLNITDVDGKEVLVMENNEWLVTGPIADLRASASAHSIRLSAPTRQVTLNVQFMSLAEKTLRAELEVEAARVVQEPPVPTELLSVLPPAFVASLVRTKEQVFESLWSPFAQAGISWPAMRVSLSGRMPHPVPIRFTSTRIDLPGGRVLSGNTVFLPGAKVISVA